MAYNLSDEERERRRQRFILNNPMKKKENIDKIRERQTGENNIAKRDDVRKKMSETRLKNPYKYWLGKTRKCPWVRNNCKGKTYEEICGNEKGMKRRLEVAKRYSGSKSHLWKGGITEKNMLERSQLKNKLWRTKVFERDDYTCKVTGIKGGKLEAHHIESFSNNPGLRTKESNGIALDTQIHRMFHTLYGRGNNTEEQLKEFIIQFQQT